MTNDILSDTIEYLFNRPWDENLSDDEIDALDDKFSETVDIYGWENTLNAILDFMYSNCVDGESACNFAHMFWGYGAYTYSVNKPYEFLGYLYYRMDMKPWEYDAADLIEGLVKELLSTNGDESHNPFVNYDYLPENDPEIIKEVEKWRAKDAR